MTTYMFNCNRAADLTYPCVHDCIGCTRPMIYREQHPRCAHVFRIMCDACLSKIAQDEALRDGLRTKGDICRCCGSTNYAVWWLGESEASVCIYEDMEFMERLLKLCDPVNATARFTNYVASLWLEDVDHFGEYHPIPDSRGHLQANRATVVAARIPSGPRTHLKLAHSY